VKIVINSCHGGFGLSDEAFEALLKRKGIDYERVASRVAFRQEIHDYYAKGHAGDDDYFISQYEYYGQRNDPDLIAVVEELGDRANGFAASLKIVEIPYGVEWQIDEYDGDEWVAEKHRTWS
jgi:hypothetical protein